MKSKTLKPRTIILYGVEYLYSIFILAWFLLPVISAYDVPVVLSGLPFVLSTQEGNPARIGFLVLVYAIPVLSLIKLASPFIGMRLGAFSDPEKTVPTIINIFLSFFVCLAVALYVFAFAKNMRFFSTIGPVTYAGVVLSIVYNGIAGVFLMKNLNRRNVTYREYLTRTRGTGMSGNGIVSFMLKTGIQKKLIVSFIGLFLVIIVILSTTLALEFRRSIVNSVVFNGITLASRYSDLIRANPAAGRIEINDYLEIAKKNNPGSELAFNSITIFRKQGKKDMYIATNSTSPELTGKLLPQNYLTFTEPGTLKNAEKKTIECVSPAILGGITIAFTVVEYADDVIYSSYFQTIVKIIIFCFFFLYVTIFLVYLFGSKIVFPILFLGMSVNKISSNLSALMSGKTRISNAQLEYDDRITSRDEIKDLSNEFRNMTSVIRGILPYISASTLKNADTATPATRKRDLTFLFTDIRGFTTLCEGLDPLQVVSILNKYLDLQSSIILNYKGDIDKFVGDEIMAVFEGPSKEINACMASMDIREAMAREKENEAKNHRAGISIGIGINTGQVVFGSVGARERMDFTSIGDTVNLAARLEGANKIYGTKSLITDNVRSKIQGQFLVREIDLITVKGKTKPVRIYEILQRTFKAESKLMEIKKLFETGLEKYREKKWKDAATYFRKNAEKYNDSPSKVFLNRIDLFASNPPAKDWNGVFNSM